jgi:hypothetical protein
MKADEATSLKFIKEEKEEEFNQRVSSLISQVSLRTSYVGVSKSFRTESITK